MSPGAVMLATQGPVRGGEWGGIPPQNFEVPPWFFKNYKFYMKHFGLIKLESSNLLDITLQFMVIEL